MAFAFPRLRPAGPAPADLVIQALRVWRGAREGRAMPYPALYQAALPSGHAMLVPAFDALFRLIEAEEGRALSIGGADRPSDDELLVIDLIGGRRDPGKRRPLLAIALRSLAILLADAESVWHVRSRAQRSA